MRRFRGRWWLAAIRPGGRPAGVWALPKGNIGQGEDPEETAVREVAEETGITAVSNGKLGDVRYVYSRGGRRIFKVVSFYLLRYRSGRIDDVPEEFRRE
ncbi:MAG TPA: NUDIX domain-containing protein, partial [Gaiellaceae bacterium]|nr:NUDIX domain-containing protein [Gaiellaceae bacterium]